LKKKEMIMNKHQENWKIIRMRNKETAWKERNKKSSSEDSNNQLILKEDISTKKDGQSVFFPNCQESY
jgi:hypothetical protein